MRTDVSRRVLLVVAIFAIVPAAALLRELTTGDPCSDTASIVVALTCAGEDAETEPIATPTSRAERAFRRGAYADCRTASQTGAVAGFVEEMELEVSSLDPAEVAAAYGASPNWPDDISARSAG